MKKLRIVVLGLLWSQLALGRSEPIFVGTTPLKPAAEFRRFSLRTRAPSNLTYMTAEQMAGKLRAITGYWHPGFIESNKIIGTNDPATGYRTNDRPTIFSVSLIEELLRDVAERVVLREKFIDPEMRVVFGTMNLSSAPSDEALDKLIESLCLNSFLLECPADVASDIKGFFRSQQALGDLDQAYANLLVNIFQIGAIFYY